jgi:hypothetical protein
MRVCARVLIPVYPEPLLVFSHELLGGLHTGLLVVSPSRIACAFLHVERGRSSKRVWRSPQIIYYMISHTVLRFTPCYTILTVAASDRHMTAIDLISRRMIFLKIACRVKVPAGNTVESLGGRAGSWYAREMPMSFMVAMENLTDPSHVSFAHHGVLPSALSSFTE